MISKKWFCNFYRWLRSFDCGFSGKLRGDWKYFRFRNASIGGDSFFISHMAVFFLFLAFFNDRWELDLKDFWRSIKELSLDASLLGAFREFCNQVQKFAHLKGLMNLMSADSRGNGLVISTYRYILLINKKVYLIFVCFVILNKSLPWKFPWNPSNVLIVSSSIPLNLWCKFRIVW